VSPHLPARASSESEILMGCGRASLSRTPRVFRHARSARGLHGDGARVLPGPGTSPPSNHSPAGSACRGPCGRVPRDLGKGRATAPVTQLTPGGLEGRALSTTAADVSTAGRLWRPRSAARPPSREREGFVGGSVVVAVTVREREGFVGGSVVVIVGAGVCQFVGPVVVQCHPATRPQTAPARTTILNATDPESTC
jgi:hypothetical protein